MKDDRGVLLPYKVLLITLWLLAVMRGAEKMRLCILFSRAHYPKCPLSSFFPILRTRRGPEDAYYQLAGI